MTENGGYRERCWNLRSQRRRSMCNDKVYEMSMTLNGQGQVENQILGRQAVKECKTKVKEGPSIQIGNHQKLGWSNMGQSESVPELNSSQN